MARQSETETDIIGEKRIRDRPQHQRWQQERNFQQAQAEDGETLTDCSVTGPASATSKLALVVEAVLNPRKVDIGMTFGF